jgi:hypothetical protein
MSLLTIVELKQHIETDLADDALQRLIDDAEDEIVERHGELEAQTDVINDASLSTCLFLSRKAESITTITEELKENGSFDSTVLDPTDYRLRGNDRQIDRLTDGPNPRSTWGDSVIIIYAPKDEENRRKRVAVDLVRLAIQYNALKSERVGDYSATSEDYERARSKLIARLESWPWA